MNNFFFRYNGFTLMESMLTVTLLLILISIVGIHYVKVLDQTRILVSKTYLHILRSGLEFYRIEYGRYPGDMGDDNQFYYLINNYLKMENPFPRQIGWVDYQGDEENYTLTVRAIDRRKTYLTASREGITP